MERFVDLSEIDPVYYEKAYYVAPDKGGARPYALLVKAMAETGKVAIAKVVMRTKEYLIVLRPIGAMLCMETMLYADEVVDPAEIEGLPGEVAIADKELEMAKMLVESASDSFDPARYRDEYREKVLRVPREECLFAVLGHLRESKRIDTILLSCEALRRQGLPVRLLVQGDFVGPDLERALEGRLEAEWVVRRQYLPELERV